MESTGAGTNGITGLEKFQPRGVVEIDLARALKTQVPEAREVLGEAEIFVPIRDQVMVRRLAEDTMTQRGTLHIPEEGKEKPGIGMVLAVGRGVMDAAGRIVPCEVEPGDMVLFGKYSGTEYLVNGETVLVMKEGQIVGVFRKRGESGQ